MPKYYHLITKEYFMPPDLNKPEVKTYKLNQLITIALDDVLTKVKIIHVFANGTALGVSTEQSFKFDKVGGVVSMTDAKEYRIEPQYRWVNIYKNGEYTNSTSFIHKFGGKYYLTEEEAKVNATDTGITGNYIGAIKVEI